VVPPAQETFPEEGVSPDLDTLKQRFQALQQEVSLEGCEPQGCCPMCTSRNMLPVPVKLLFQCVSDPSALVCFPAQLIDWL
jgi:hypothetical protein